MFTKRNTFRVPMSLSLAFLLLLSLQSAFALSAVCAGVDGTSLMAFQEPVLAQCRLKLASDSLLR